MFDEKHATQRWRVQLAETGALFEADLDELESHLRDHLDGLAEVGITGEAAFTAATDRLGETRLLADKFAAVNPLLAWRAALFWMTGGILIALVGRPVIAFGLDATILGCMALGLGKAATSVAVWTESLAAPIGFFAFLFPLAARRVESPLPWARAPVFRVCLIVGSALLMLGFHLHSYFGWLDRVEWRWSRPMALVAWNAASSATYGLAIAAPLFLIGIAVRQRALAMKNRVAAAPLFWLAVGIFVGAIKWELHLFVRSAVLTAGGLAELQPAQMSILMWVVALGCPALLFGSTYAFLRHRSPGPARVLRAPLVLVAMMGSAALAIGAVFATGPVSSYGTFRPDVWNAGSTAWLFAGIVTSCALPVIVGSLILRLHRAGTLAARTTGASPLTS